MPATSRPEPPAFADVYDVLYDDAALENEDERRLIFVAQATG